MSPFSNRMASIATLAVAVIVFAAGCGPTLIEIEPKNVVDVAVRPASGQLLFCPGDPFLVEVVAKLSDGTSCSTKDAARGCMAQTDVLIDPAQVRLESRGATLQGGDSPLVVVPDGDPLATAADGVALKAWLEKAGARSIEGESKLKPVYDCRMGTTLRESAPASGPVAAAGPEVTIAVTSFSTPFYPDAALVRIEAMGQRRYVVSPSSDRPVRVTTQGQTGAPGAAGAPGVAGAAGEDRSQTAAACEKGGDGANGTDGGPGASGGDGGIGGAVLLLLDDRSADKLRSRVIIESLGGEAGAAGPGGVGGAGGPGGAGGLVRPDCKLTVGADGRPGAAGAAGKPGKPGASGPPHKEEARVRKDLFASELGAIEKIEAQGGR